MNKLIIELVAFSCLSSFAAHAETVLVEHHASSVSYAGTNFRFDSQKGAAWLEVKLVEDLGMPDEISHGGPNLRHTTVIAEVKGLSYDAAAAQIVFTGFTNTFGNEPWKVVCGTVTEKRGVFGMKQIIHLTGACRTYTVKENRGESVYFEAK